AKPAKQNRMLISTIKVPCYVSTEIHVPAAAALKQLNMWMTSPCPNCKSAMESGLHSWMQHLSQVHTVPHEWPSSRAQRLTGPAAAKPYTTITESKKKRKLDTVPRPLNSFMVSCPPHVISPPSIPSFPVLMLSEERALFAQSDALSLMKNASKTAELCVQSTTHLRGDNGGALLLDKAIPGGFKAGQTNVAKPEEVPPPAAPHNLHAPADPSTAQGARSMGVNGGNIFAQHIRRNVLCEFGDASNSAISQQLGSLWKSVPRHMRMQYDEEACRLADIHKIEFPGYRYQPKKRGQDCVVDGDPMPLRVSKRAVKQRHLDDATWSYSQRKPRKTDSKSLAKTKKTMKEKNTRKAMKPASNSSANDSAYSSCGSSSASPSLPSPPRQNNKCSLVYTSESSNSFPEYGGLYSPYFPSQDANYKLHSYDVMGNPIEYQFHTYQEMQSFVKNMEHLQSGRNYSGNSCGESSLSTTAATSPQEGEAYARYYGYYDNCSYYSNTSSSTDPFYADSH
ncbi:hypothetical protein Ciccas_010410, partial [Cichlidogyrus casuarinus]